MSVVFMSWLASPVVKLLSSSLSDLWPSSHIGGCKKILSSIKSLIICMYIYAQFSIMQRFCMLRHGEGHLTSVLLLFFSSEAMIWIFFSFFFFLHRGVRVNPYGVRLIPCDPGPAPQPDPNTISARGHPTEQSFELGTKWSPMGGDTVGSVTRAKSGFTSIFCL